MQTLAPFALALALATGVGFALSSAASKADPASAQTCQVVPDEQTKAGPVCLFVLDNASWQAYLYWHQEARQIQPAACIGDCSPGATTARISLTRPLILAHPY